MLVSVYTGCPFGDTRNIARILELTPSVCVQGLGVRVSGLGFRV